MKSKISRFSIKDQIRAEKERERRIATAIFSALILIIIILSAYFGCSYLNLPQNQATNFESLQPKAAIVDQLSLTFPNRTFIETATNILEQANYIVDYYPAKQVTVEFYRSLPTYNYRIIILRTHSSATELHEKNFVETPVSIFTSEPYSLTKYVYEQLTDQLLGACLTNPEPSYYFAIAPKFVTESMKGSFQNSIIIMMGCEGIMNTKMAEAFIKKGAKAYISWNASVSAGHTDTATTILLRHLITEKQTIEQAIEKTIKEAGPDPAYNSVLAYYPPTIADQTV